MNTGRMNLLEEMGRIDSEKMNKNRTIQNKMTHYTFNTHSAGPALYW